MFQPKTGIGEKTVDSICEAIFILRRNERAALVVNQLGVASYVVGDHGQAGGHGFEDGVGQAFGVGREDGHVHGSEDSRDVATIAEEDGAVGEAECSSLLLKFRTKGAIASEKEFHVRHALMNLGGDAEKAGVILIVRIHARDHAHAECTGAAGQSGTCGLKGRSGQGVSDDGEFLARHAGSSEQIGGGLRVAHYCVAPSKGGGLCAQFCRGQQISELPMTADYDRHTGEAGCGNQRQVGVEIEGVGDLNMTAAQIATQLDASPQGLPSIQAATEREFRNVSYLVPLEGHDGSRTLNELGMLTC